MLSAYYLCWIIYSNALQTITRANTMSPDQIAPEEQSDLGHYCLQYIGYQSIYTKQKRAILGLQNADSFMSNSDLKKGHGH